MLQDLSMRLLRLIVAAATVAFVVMAGTFASHVRAQRTASEYPFSRCPSPPCG